MWFFFSKMSSCQCISSAITKKSATLKSLTNLIWQTHVNDNILFLLVFNSSWPIVTYESCKTAFISLVMKICCMHPSISPIGWGGGGGGGGRLGLWCQVKRCEYADSLIVTGFVLEFQSKKVSHWQTMDAWVLSHSWTDRSLMNWYVQRQLSHNAGLYHLVMAVTNRWILLP